MGVVQSGRPGGTRADDGAFVVGGGRRGEACEGCEGRKKRRKENEERMEVRGRGRGRQREKEGRQEEETTLFPARVEVGADPLSQLGDSTAEAEGG